MKEIVSEIITKKTIFKSVNGREFASKEECEAYEQSYLGSIKKCFLSIPHIQICGVETYIPYSTEDDITIMFRPRNLEDIHVTNQLLNSIDQSDSNHVTQNDIGVTLILSLGYDGLDSNWFLLYRKDDYLKKIETEINEIEEKMLSENANQ